MSRSPALSRRLARAVQAMTRDEQAVLARTPGVMFEDLPLNVRQLVERAEQRRKRGT